MSPCPGAIRSYDGALPITLLTGRPKLSTSEDLLSPPRTPYLLCCAPLCRTCAKRALEGQGDLVSASRDVSRTAVSIW